MRRNKHPDKISSRDAGGEQGKTDRYTLYTHPISEKTNVREREIMEVSVKHMKTPRCPSFSEKVNVLP